MITLKMIEIQENNWMISRKNIIVGFIFKTIKLNVLSAEYSGEYEDFEDFSKNHKVKLAFEQIETKDRVQQELEGFPIKHANVFNIEHDPILTYTKLEHSQDRYAAGYFGIKFKENHQPSFCPRMSTLTSYEYIGPFKTTLEMQHAIRTS